MDGSGWGGVYKALKKNGHKVSVVQNPTTSLADYVATTRRVVAEQDGPVTLVGHSYGGAVITEAGNDPKVAKLVYIAGFAPDNGESVNTLLKDPPPGAPVPPILPQQDGYLFLDKAKFRASFAGRRRRPTAPRSWPIPRCRGAWTALGGTITDAAWRTKPSWYMVTTEDKDDLPAAQRFMSERAGSTVVEVQGSHSVYVSRPEAVAALIEQAAAG